MAPTAESYFPSVPLAEVALTLNASTPAHFFVVVFLLVLAVIIGSYFMIYRRLATVHRISELPALAPLEKSTIAAPSPPATRSRIISDTNKITVPPHPTPQLMFIPNIAIIPPETSSASKDVYTKTDHAHLRPSSAIRIKAEMDAARSRMPRYKAIETPPRRLRVGVAKATFRRHKKSRKIFCSMTNGGTEDETPGDSLHMKHAYDVRNVQPYTSHSALGPPPAGPLPPVPSSVDKQSREIISKAAERCVSSKSIHGETVHHVNVVFRFPVIQR